MKCERTDRARSLEGRLVIESSADGIELNDAGE